MLTQSKKLAVNIQEAAAMIGVSVRTVQQYIAAEILPTKKIGRRRVVTVSALEEFLRSDHASPAQAERK
jgi:excisionase family DNA binding protein